MTCPQLCSLPYKKPLLILAATAAVALLISALVSIKRREANQIRGKKIYWVLISFVDFIGPITYFIFGRKKRGQLSP